MALAIILGAGSMAQGQATPAGGTPEYNPGPTLPRIDGNFQYSLFASQVAQTGFSDGVTSSTNLGGSMEYLSKNATLPFSALYSGGYLFTTQPGVGSSTFQNASVSQGLVRGGWAMGVSDSVSYLPNAPASGLTGVPGAGGIGLQPITGGTIPSQTVLTDYSRRVSNSVSGNIERNINRRTSISGNASYGILRFLDNDGENSDQITGMVSLNRRLDARNTLSANVVYQTYSFTGLYATQPNIETRGINVVYERLWTRALTSAVSIGPQWISGYTLTPLQLEQYPPGTNPVVPSRVDVAVNASLSYTHRYTVSSLSYSRGINNGSGVQAGATADTLTGQIFESFGPNWSGAVSGVVANTTGLVGGSTSTQTFNFGVQVTRRITRHISAYASDSIQHQSVGNLVGANAFHGTSNSAAIGISWAPRSSRLNPF